MDLDSLQRPRGPFLHILRSDPSAASDLVRGIDHPGRDGVTVRAVRGPKAATPAGLFDEFAAALQFPPYFGENWDALDECLADLSWLKAPAAVLLILDAGQLLHARPAERGQFWQMLDRIGKERAGAVGDTVAHAGHKKPGEAHTESVTRLPAFHTVLQTDAAGEATLRESLKTTGVPFAQLH